MIDFLKRTLEIVVGEKTPQDTVEFRNYLKDLHKTQLYRATTVISFVMLVYFLIYFPHWYLIVLPIGIIAFNVLILYSKRYIKSNNLDNFIFLVYLFTIPSILFIMFGENGLIENYVLGFLVIAPYTFPIFSGYRVIFVTIGISYLFFYVYAQYAPLYQVNERLMRVLNFIIFALLVIGSIDVFNKTNLRTFDKLVKSNEALRKRNNDFKELAVAAHHDLLEPVRTIFTLTKMMKEEMLKGRSVEEENINYLIQTSEKLTRIMKGFKQLETLQEVPEIENINLFNFFGEIKEGRKDNFILNCYLSKSFEVPSDRKLLYILMEHFLTVFKEEVKGTLTFSVYGEENKNQLYFSCQDIQLKPTEVERYNNPFDQLSPNAVHLFFGYKIAEILNIKVYLETQKSESRIYFNFPNQAPNYTETLV